MTPTRVTPTERTAVADWERTLDELVRARRPALVGYASLFTIDIGAAEDLVQDALVRTFARPRSFPDVPSAEGYVRRAIRTSFLDSTRRRSAWTRRRHLFTEDEPRRGPGDAVAAGVDVGAALQLLSPRQRACVVLRHFEDMTVPDVAAELGLSDGAVKRYLSDATAVLRTALGDDLDTSQHDLPGSTLTSVPVRVTDRRSHR